MQQKLKMNGSPPNSAALLQAKSAGQIQRPTDRMHTKLRTNSPDGAWIA
jgi:hypothetical protein